VPAALQRRWGHTDFGVYARVASAGDIKDGDKTEAREDAKELRQDKRERRRDVQELKEDKRDRREDRRDLREDRRDRREDRRDQNN
jgi:MOSC domain-containing protein YiiM